MAGRGHKRQQTALLLLLLLLLLRWAQQSPQLASIQQEQQPLELHWLSLVPLLEQQAGPRARGQQQQQQQHFGSRCDQ
jgi:hypothetical protein